MIDRLIALGHRLLSDAHVRQHEPEIAIALAQALVIMVPILLAGIGLMAALP